MFRYIYEQLYNGKLAKRYGLTTTNECHRQDSCTYIAGECLKNIEERISRHDADCQRVHAAVYTTVKCSGAL
jgi:hypothetical protein